MTKILIIEDETSVSLLYQRAFNYEGFELITAFDGLEGLSLAKTHRPNLILLDIILPKMNGLKVLEKLKNDDKTKNIPVVILTNLNDMKEIEKAIALGAIKYITKSQYDPKQVIDIVKKIIK